MNSSERCVKTQAKKGTAINMKLKRNIYMYIRATNLYIYNFYIHTYICLNRANG